MNRAVLKSPVGYLEIAEENNTIIYIHFIDQFVEIEENNSFYLRKCIEQLNNYFLGKLLIFDLKLNPSGTDFQKNIWKEVSKIPFGSTKTYQEIADAVGDPGAVRAVGNANSHNPIPIIIPCHRVVGSNGKLTGYAGGIDKKDWLLQHELKFSKKEMQLGLF